MSSRWQHSDQALAGLGKPKGEVWGNVLEGGDWLSRGRVGEQRGRLWCLGTVSPSPSGLILPGEGQRRKCSLPWKWRHTDPSAKSREKKKKRQHPIQTCVLSFP